jgi:hypothetical protein
MLDAKIHEIYQNHSITGMMYGKKSSQKKVEPITTAAPYRFSLGVNYLNIKGKDGKVAARVRLDDYEVGLMVRARFQVATMFEDHRNISDAIAAMKWYIKACTGMPVSEKRIERFG